MNAIQYFRSHYFQWYKFLTKTTSTIEYSVLKNNKYLEHMEFISKDDNFVIITHLSTLRYIEFQCDVQIKDCTKSKQEKILSRYISTKIPHNITISQRLYNRALNCKNAAISNTNYYDITIQDDDIDQLEEGCCLDDAYAYSLDQCCCKCMWHVPVFSHPKTDGKSITNQKGWACIGFPDDEKEIYCFSGWKKHSCGCELFQREK